MACLALVYGCGGDDDDGGSTSGPPSGELSFFGFEDAFDPELVEPFEKEFPDVSLQTAAFSSGDEAITKLKAGFQADVINICVEDTERMVAEGLLQPLDTSALENWDKLSPAFKELDGVTVDGEVYLAPMVGGTNGLMFSEPDVPEGISSYAELFDDRFAGKIAVEAAPENAIGAAAFALGIEDPINMTDEELAQVEEFLIEKKPNIRTFFNNDADILNLYKNGEVIASTGYQGLSNLAKKDDMPVDFSLADEGTVTWTCGYGISADAKNVNAANALINYYAGVGPQSYQAEAFSYLVSNSKVKDAVSKEVAEQAGLDTVDQIQNPIPFELPEDYEAWQEVMERVKAS
jgi:spermidine/putrescine transport system substrate-binding protein